MQLGSPPETTLTEEYCVRFDSDRKQRVLVIPALFGEANKLRHFTLEAMRLLDAHGIDTALPDLPGTNESLARIEDMTLEDWRTAMTSQASAFTATHVLAIRGGALCAPTDLPGLALAPASGSSILSGMLRARVIADREVGVESTRDALLTKGREQGLTLAGFALGANMIGQLEQAEPDHSHLQEIRQADLGGTPLWLRAEPDHDPAQAEALARVVAEYFA